MKKQQAVPDPTFGGNEKQFQSISEAARTTGLSARYLREACKAGLIPHVMCGRCFKIDIVALRAASEEKGRCRA